MSQLPHICAVCLTYGRVKQLEEAIQSFLNQTYSGNKSMVVFNTCKEQQLFFSHPEVEVFNYPGRPATLGETRNGAIALAERESLIVNLDDDDLILPNHFDNCVNGFNPEVHQWSWQDKMVFMEGIHITAVKPGAANGFSFLKSAWVKVMMYEAVNTGEDHRLMRKMKAELPGVVVPLKDDDASYVYRWCPPARFHTHLKAVAHISGFGWDTNGEPNGMQRCEAHVKDRMAKGLEPTGRIELKPQWHIDYKWLLAAQLERWRTNYR